MDYRKALAIGILVSVGAVCHATEFVQVTNSTQTPANVSISSWPVGGLPISGTLSSTPVPMQVISSSGGPTNVGYQVGGGSVPVNMISVGGTSVSVNGDGGINVHQTNGGSGGTSSNFGSAFPSAGTAGGFVNPNNNMGAGRVDSSSNVYTHTLIDGTSNTVQITGTPTVNQGSPPWSVSYGGGLFNVGSSTPLSVNQNTALWNVGSSTPLVVNDQHGVYSVTPTSGIYNVASSTPLTVNQGTSLWNVGSSTPITVNQGTALWNIGSSTPLVVNDQHGVYSVTPTSGIYNVASSTPLTVQQLTPANLQSSVSVNGTSNTVTAQGAVDVVVFGTTTFSVQSTTFSFSSLGYNQLVSTTTSKKVTVIGWDAVAGGTTNIQWFSAKSPATPVSGLYPLVANVGLVHECGRFCFQSNAGEGLGLNLSAGQSVGGTLEYIAGP